jgi:hypothetical protein
VLPALLDGGKRRKYREKVTSCLKAPDLKKEKSTPRELSGGEQQRVCHCPGPDSMIRTFFLQMNRWETWIPKPVPKL